MGKVNVNTGSVNAQRVLVMDDSKSLRQYVEDLLLAAGYQVCSAPDGKAGLELIRNAQPDVVLLDIEMPVMNGREVLAALNPEGRLFSVVVLTSLTEMGDCLSAFGIGADDYMAKPFNDDELLARVRAAARTAQLKKELAASRDQALDLLHKYEIAEKKLAEERELTAISKMISGIADKMNSPIGFVRSNIGTMMRYSDTLMELCERITALHARKAWTAEDIRKALNEEIKWMRQSKIDNIRQYLGPLVKETVQGIDRIAAIVRKLLQIDIASGHSEKRPENMISLINNIAGQIRERIPGITLSIEAEAESFMVECDKVRISAALENIIDNAIESLNGTGWILIKLCNDKKSVIIDISDTGVGIPQNSLGAVFDPFFSGNTLPEKIGLGLTLAKYLINAHKGSIVISSDEGKGTRVRVELPMSAAETTLHNRTSISA
jgi:two-component system, NtrC family, sensor kinase